MYKFDLTRSLFLVSFLDFFSDLSSLKLSSLNQRLLLSPDLGFQLLDFPLSVPVFGFQLGVPSFQLSVSRFQVGDPCFQFHDLIAQVEQHSSMILRDHVRPFRNFLNFFRKIPSIGRDRDIFWRSKFINLKRQIIINDYFIFWLYIFDIQNVHFKYE